MIQLSIRLLRRLHDGLRETEQVYMVLVSVVIGLLAGFCAVGFRLLIQLLNRVAWHQGQYTLEYMYSLPFWWKIWEGPFVVVFGLALSGMAQAVPRSEPGG